MKTIDLPRLDRSMHTLIGSFRIYYVIQIKSALSLSQVILVRNSSK